MISSLDSSAQRFLTATERLKDRIDTAQLQMSSGKRIENAADAPDQVSALLRLRGQIARNDTIKANLNRVDTEVDTAEEVLAKAVTRMENAAVLGAQGTSTSQTAETRATLAAQIGDIMEQMAGIANTAVDGRYIFSGDADQSVPFSLDAASDSGVARLLTSTESTRQIETPNGTTFIASLSGNDIFDPRTEDGDPASGNVFHALQSLQAALLEGDSDAITTAVDSVRTAGTYLNQQLSFYGVTQNRVAAALEDASQAATDLDVRLAAVEDADMTQAIIDLTQGKLQLDAAIQARSLQPTTTLFDLL